VMLLPRELDMLEVGKHVPLPPKKPKIPPEPEAKKKSGTPKQEAGKSDSKSDGPSDSKAADETKAVPAKSRRQAGPARSPRS
jgi:hypothetical protein